MRLFDKGDPVNTPFGPGEVVYRRMAPPDYATPECYSVRLDSKKHLASYTGTILLPEQVTERK